LAWLAYWASQAGHFFTGSESLLLGKNSLKALVCRSEKVIVERNRFVNQTIPLNVSSGSPRSMTAQVVSLDYCRADLWLDRAIPRGTAVLLDVNDGMILGEVANCTREAGKFRAKVTVREAIPLVSDLARLANALRNCGMPDGIAAGSQMRQKTAC
jgi:hypothetical protein